MSAPLLVGSAPATAGSVTSAGTRSSSAVAGDVLFWSRSLTEGFVLDGSIVKASAATPSVVATELASSDRAGFTDPELSPDGSKLAYVRYLTDSGDWNVEVRNLATGSTTVLATRTPNGNPAGYRLEEPTWSPNGETIAYVDVQRTNEHPEPDPNVRVVAAAGGPSRLVDDSAVSAAWRPDGRLTVARYNPGNGQTTGLWITGATPGDAVLIPGSAGASDQAWSPDGARIAFSRLAAVNPHIGPGSIETLPAAGGTPTVIVPAAEFSVNEAPVWSSNGQRVYFTHHIDTGIPGGPSQIMQVARTGGAVSPVVEGRNFSPSITTKVAAPVRSASHDFTGDGYADVIGRMSNGDLRVYFGNGLGLSGYRRIGTGWGGMTAIFTPGDFNSDGHNDVIGRLPNGDLRLYTGVGGGPGGSQLIGTGFGGMTAVFSPGDFTGDGHPDVIARTSTGQLRLYVGTGVRLTGGTVIGPSGWNGITAVFSPGDFNGDDHPDVIGRLPGGELVVYHGNGVRLSGSSLIGTGWNGLSALFSPGDFNLDGKPDVIGRISNGDLRVYYGTGTRLSGYRVIGTGWNSVNPIL